MTAFTTPDNIPYPDDYSEPADVPVVLEGLAEATQTALSARAKSVSTVGAGNGLTGGGQISANPSLAVGAGTGIKVNANDVAVDTNVIATKAYADGKVINATGSSTSSAPSQAAVGTALNGKANLASPSFTGAPKAPTPPDASSDTSIATTLWVKRYVSHWEWNVGTLAPGEEKTLTGLSKSSGSAVIVSVQHSSTYIFAVANTTNPEGTYYDLKVRNSTTATTHTNVKVNVLVVKAD